MGDEMTRRTRPAGGIWWSLANLSCALLEAQEREVVRGDLGDLAESGISGARAFREVAGLVARRQAAAWLDWRPWFMLAAVVLPIGLLLSHASRWWGITAALKAATYWSLGDIAYLANPGWRQELMRAMVTAGVAWLALIGWSWTSGFVLGRLSREALWSTLTLFALIVFAGTFGTVPTAQRHVMTSPLQFQAIALVAPALLRTFLVMLPAILGAFRGARRTALPLTPILVGALLLVVLTSMASRGLEGSLVFGRGTFPADPGPDGFVNSADDPRPLWPLSLVMLWPAAYMLTISTWQRWRDKRILA
jgi:hypothetical protein